ncbi:MAG TPA: SURF1 family protein [Anaerolineales bacterium]
MTRSNLQSSIFNLQLLFSRRWWKTTILAILAIGVMVRLGIWQLDRLEQRRLFNARVQEQLDQPMLELKAHALGADLEAMEYREVHVTGEYDHSYEVALRNQAYNNQFGVHLITPLRIVGSDQAVLIDRGWIPYEDYESGQWAEFAEAGQVEVRGRIRVSQTRPTIGFRSDPTPAPGEGPLRNWNMLNVSRIAEMVPYSLLPVYIQQAPDPAWTAMPYRSLPEIELTEGSHLGYAVQWFTFALILGIGYPVYVYRQQIEMASKVQSSSQPTFQH